MLNSKYQKSIQNETQIKSKLNLNVISKILNVIYLNIQKHKSMYILILLTFISIISIWIQKNQREQEIIINNQSLKSDTSKICVYITGEVKNPGVYYISNDSRLSDIIDISGGLTDKADIDKLNLAQKLNDSDKIIIYKKSEQITSNDNITDNEELEESESEMAKVNINTASKEELKTLNGIGDSTAEKIIKYRKNNTFTTIEDIMNVNGIGESKFNNIKDDITVD